MESSKLGKIRFFILILLSINLVGALSVNIPTGVNAGNYSGISVNNSQYLEGLTAQGVSNLSGWFHDTVNHITYLIHSNEKLCIGSGCITNPFYKVTIEGGMNVTGTTVLDKVCTANALTGNLECVNNVSAKNFNGNWNGSVNYVPYLNVSYSGIINSMGFNSGFPGYYNYTDSNDFPDATVNLQGRYLVITSGSYSGSTYKIKSNPGVGWDTYAIELYVTPSDFTGEHFIITDMQPQNKSIFANKYYGDGSLLTGVGNASTGNCPAGQVVMNTTSSGVQCVDRVDPSTTYYPNSTSVSGGSYTDTNVLNRTFWYDGDTLNFTEGSGANPLDIYINFTGVTDFSQLVLREYYLGSSSHYMQVQIFDYDSSTWESYFEFVGQAGQTIISVPIFDSTDHINNGNVSVRLHHVQTGISSHRLYLDFAWLVDGNNVGASTNLDGYARYDAGYNNFTSTNSYWFGGINWSGVQVNTTQMSNSAGKLNILESWLTTFVNSLLNTQVHSNTTIAKNTSVYNTYWYTNQTLNAINQINSNESIVKNNTSPTFQVTRISGTTGCMRGNSTWAFMIEGTCGV